MKKSIILQASLVGTALVLLVFVKFNQPPFQFIPTTIEIPDDREDEEEMVEEDAPEAGLIPPGTVLVETVYDGPTSPGDGTVDPPADGETLYR
jgi:hypothetical protein